MEDKDYPGYANIPFQRRRGLVFSIFLLDIESMARFSAMIEEYLVVEAERRRGQEKSSTLAGRQSVAELTGSFKDTLRSAMLVTFYGRFESFLFDVCRAIYDNGVCKANPGRLKNIDSAKDYLKRVPNLEFPAGTQAWNLIKDIAELRHMATHNNLVLRQEDDERWQFLRRIPHVIVNTSGEVWLERGILEHAVRTLETFTSSLERALGPTGRVPMSQEQRGGT